MAAQKGPKKFFFDASATVLCSLLILLINIEILSAKTLPENDRERTADLSKLINETLTINSNKHKHLTSADSHLNEKPNLRDDWTFDRVEYDLIEFLQELNARYQYSNNNTDHLSDDSVKAIRNNDDDDKTLSAKSELIQQAAASPATIDVNETIQESKHPSTSSNAGGSNKLMTSTTTLLPVSLASGDHELSESNWQYGIFDRFTRARPTQSSGQSGAHHIQGNTTPEPLSVASAGSSKVDMRSFNSDECGLRTYVQDDVNGHSPVIASMFPELDLLPLSDYDRDKHLSSDPEPGSEARKELSQRRQRLPPQLVANISRRKQPSGQSTDMASSSLNEGDKHSVVAANSHSVDVGYDSSLAADEDSQPSSMSEQQSEFNLSSRRQWLQQQLGNTLQMLGFNASSGSQSLSDSFLNQSSGLSLSSRENMMKKSLPPFKLSKKSMDEELKEQHDDLLLIKELDQLKARQDELKLEARVIGGTDARLGDSPWSVSLQALVPRPGTGGVEYRHYCGGTIISEYYILTAAHCLDFMVGRESRLFVVMGDLNWRMSTSSMYGQRSGIDKLIIHSGYKSTAFGHDIGLIKTRDPIKPVRVNGRYIINSVCLPEKNVEHSGEAELVGWGLFSNRNEMADSLQIADVPILPRPLCVDLYRRRTGLLQWLIGIELITDKQICAGTFGRGICQGDSGSALVFNEKVAKHRSASSSIDGRAANTRLRNYPRDQQSRATVIGVVAFGGIRRCSYQSLPGVYMQTSKYLDWILPRISA